jgi:hypothetical protein
MKWLIAISLVMISAAAAWLCLEEMYGASVRRGTEGVARLISLFTLSHRSATATSEDRNWQGCFWLSALCFIAGSWWLWRLVMLRLLGELPTTGSEMDDRRSGLDWL